MSSTLPTLIEKPKSRSKTGGGSKGGGGTGGGGGGNQATVRLRIVVRHLPSLLKEEEFRGALAEYINEETTENFSWVQGKIPSDRNKLPTFSRCYIKFKTPTQITALNDALRSHGQFVDSKGNATNPQMEYAPFQKFPKKGVRVDARAGTIDSDPDFIAFIASLHGSSATPTAGDGTQPDGTVADGTAAANGRAVAQDDPLSAPLPIPEKDMKPKTTPLVEFIKQQKAAAASDKASTGGRSKSDKSKEGRDGKEGSTRRSEKRRLEKSRGKGKEKDDHDKDDKTTKQTARAMDIEPAAILKREGSGVGTLRREGSGVGGLLRRTDSNMSNTGSGSKSDKSPATDVEKPKRERRRERGNASSVAAILQRDLGLAGPRRSRVSKTALETAPIVESTNPTLVTTVQSEAPPAINATLSSNAPQTQQETATKAPRSRGGPRRDRRNRLEREEGTASAVSGSPQPQPAPVAILKKEASSNTALPLVSLPMAPTLLKRESSVSSPAAAAQIGPAATPASPGKVQSPTTPTAPKAGGSGGGGRRHGRGEGRGGNAAGGGGGGRRGSQHTSIDVQSGAPTTPTAEANGPNGGRQGRGRRGSNSGGGDGGGGRGGFRGGRGRGSGGGGTKGRGGAANANAGTNATGGASWD